MSMSSSSSRPAPDPPSIAKGRFDAGVYVHVRIEPELKARFNEQCDRDGATASALIRTWIADYVGAHPRSRASIRGERP